MNTIEIRADQNDCAANCNGCEFTSKKGSKKEINEIPKHIIDIYNKLKIISPNNKIHMGDNISKYNKNIDLSFLNGSDFNSFNVNQDINIIDETLEKLNYILQNGLDTDYVTLSHRYKNSTNDSFSEYLEYVNNKVPNIIKGTNISTFQNNFGYNSIKNKDFINLLTYFPNLFFKNINDLIEDKSLLTQNFYSNDISIGGLYKYNDGKIDIDNSFRFISERYGDTNDTTHEVLYRLINGEEPLIITLSNDFIMFQHSIKTVNNTNLRIGYNEFNDILDIISEKELNLTEEVYKYIIETVHKNGK